MDDKSRFTSNVVLRLVGNLNILEHKGIETKLLDKVRAGFWFDFLTAADDYGLLFRTSRADGMRGTLDTKEEMAKEEAAARAREFQSKIDKHFAIDKIKVETPSSLVLT